MIGISIDRERLRILNDTNVSVQSSNQLFRSFEDYPLKLKRAIDWLVALGVNVSNQSRHRTYLKSLEDYVSSGASLKEALESDSELSKVIFETYELVRIFRNFEGEEPEGLREKLLMFVDGPDFYNEELATNSSNRARNYGVEVSFGSEMTMLGLSVSYGHGNHPEPLVFTNAGNVAIECKRPYTRRADKFGTIFKEGASKVLSYDSNEFSITSRILVIDLTRFINPECEPFTPDSGMAQSGSFSARIDRIKKAVFSAYSESKHKNLEGIIFRATYPMIYPSNNNALTWSSRPLCIPLIENPIFLNELGERYNQLTYVRNNTSASTLKNT